MEEKILTPDQVAQVLQIHPFTVLKFIKQGRLKASKLGRVYRIRSTDVEKFLDDQTSQVRSKGVTGNGSKSKPVPGQQALEISDSQQVSPPEKSEKLEVAADAALIEPVQPVINQKQEPKTHHPHPNSEPDHYVLG